MISNLKGKLLVFAAMAMVAACASKPPNLEKLPDTADASAELESTQRMVQEGKDANLEILAPKNFEKAQAKLKDAQEDMVKGKSKEKILEAVAESRGWLQQANERASIVRATAKDLSDARSGAVRASAPALYPKEFAKVDEGARDLTEDAEKGNLAGLTKKGDKITAEYHDLEKHAVTKNFLGEADINLKAAEKADAKKYSPRTYEATKAKIEEVHNLIDNNPRDMERIAREAAMATDQSKFLLTVNEKTKAGNTEDLVLQNVKQQHAITGLSSGLAVAETELAQKNATLAQKNAAQKTAEELRNQLKPNEAEVFVENNMVKVRLKGVQFGSNSTKLNKKSTALLEKVDKTLGAVGASAITVEGHTDSVGEADANREISAKRAQVVQDYMVQKGNIASSQIRSVGLGEENPVSDNKTAKGRAENRRIDLVIEPKVQTE